MDKLVDFQWTSSGSQASQPFPAFLQSKSALKNVFMSEVKISGTIPSSVGSLPSVTSLMLTTISDLQGPIPTSLLSCKSLEILQLKEIPTFSASMPSDWSQATALSTLTFADVKVSGSLPTKYPPNLASFQVSKTDVDGTIPQELVDIATLESLDIGDSQVSGTIPAPTDLQNSKLLQYSVSNTKVTSMHPNVLKTKNLEFAYFFGNKLNGSLPSKVGFDDCTDSSKLKFLMMHANEFVGPIPSSYFSQTPDLNSFFAQNNKLSGELPSSITESKNLVIFDVSGNTLSGQIPGDSKWSELVQLQAINLNNNYFSGTIPSGIFQRPIEAPSFFVFDVSGNRLNICQFPTTSYTVPSSFAGTCAVSSQSPQECGCPTKWPSACTTATMPAACPPAAPPAPIAIAPFAPVQAPTPSACTPTAPNALSLSPTSPRSSPSPSASPSLTTSPEPRAANSPRSNNASKANLSIPSFVLALASFIALAHFQILKETCIVSSVEAYFFCYVS